ncbi:hypothetical protein GCM10011391_08640 [Pullulanibacillus camelliae]|uniref:Uncharacterized protein n=1 Tax=Pullulanibacillus camelliae TaxID=1707096 RepID=A0A8J2VLX7_9BACL|nr:hypothetical protein [Pullulanibacillus camelliae]GGE32231.1 hypothetical protein GCM10011391_08640 [Pullulanibacillus camelliae]
MKHMKTLTILSFYPLLGIFFVLLYFRLFSITYLILLFMIFYMIFAPFLILLFDEIVHDPAKDKTSKDDKP